MDGRTSIARTSLTGLRKGDSISTNAAERVQYRVAPTSLSDLCGDRFWCDTVPAFFVEQAAMRIERKVPETLGEV